MAPLRIFRRKRKKIEETVAEKTLLDELCGDDAELKGVLSRTLLLNPRMTAEGGGIDPHAEKAQEYEKNKDYFRARVEYQVAGELALYEGKLAQVQKFFKKAAEVDPDYPHRSILEFLTKKENAERAWAVAQEYYARTAKPAEKK